MRFSSSPCITGDQSCSHWGLFSTLSASELLGAISPAGRQPDGWNGRLSPWKGTAMHDLVIRNGTVIDGTGAPHRQVDIAIDEGTITAVERKAGLARRDVNAEELLVAPGWVDIHTHYDGQATWDPAMTPSSWHGVTTTIFGNCGVGFAPVRPGSETYLINLMEGVEDIPEIVLSEGLNFRWKTFGEYLDVLEESLRVMDVGVQVPHAALRFYVMGDRGADHRER